MKRLTRSKFLVLILSVLLALAFTGCGEDKSGNTIDEPEITVDYLTEEYAAQLTTDGADILMGSVVLEKNDDGTYSLHIEEQEVVPSSNYEEGYYIADKNVSKDVQLGPNARMTCFVDGKPAVVTADEFIKNNDGDQELLYNVFLMGNSAELILAVDPASVITE